MFKVFRKVTNGDKFFDMLEAQGDCLGLASDLFKKIRLTPVPGLHWDILMHDIEHDGDKREKKIITGLDEVFLTPFDREDIHELACVLDDILDFADDAVEKMTDYELIDDPHIISLIAILADSLRLVHGGIYILRHLQGRADELQQKSEGMSSLEHEADRIKRKATAHTYEVKPHATERAVTDNEFIALVTRIKKKEIVESLECAVNKCKDAFDMLISIKIKHS